MRPISEGPGASYRRDAAGRCDQSAMANGVSRTGRDSLRRPRLFSGIRSRATNQRRGNASHARDGVRDPLDFFKKFFGAMIMASRAITISAYNNQASSLATNYFFSLSAALFYVFNLITPFPLWRRGKVTRAVAFVLRQRRRRRRRRRRHFGYDAECRRPLMEQRITKPESRTSWTCRCSFRLKTKKGT